MTLTLYTDEQLRERIEKCERAARLLPAFAEDYKRKATLAERELMQRGRKIR